MFKTYQPTAKDITRKWNLIDAEGQVLGRMCTGIAKLLQGKQKPTYSAHMDSGDYVVVINAEKIVLTGRKEEQKKYYRYSGFPGGLREISYAQMKEKSPARIVELAVKNMLPKNRLQDPRMGRLKVCVGGEHPYGDRVKERESISKA